MKNHVSTVFPPMTLAIPLQCFTYVNKKKCKYVICLAKEHHEIQKNSHAFQDRIRNWKCWWGGNQSTREKPLGADKRTNKNLNPHMTPGQGIKPGYKNQTREWRALSPLRYARPSQTELSNRLVRLVTLSLRP